MHNICIPSLQSPSLQSPWTNSWTDEYMLKRGYVVIAQNTPDVNYVEMAYVLALSIKLTQPHSTNVCLITDEEPPSHIAAMFDEIVYFPEDDTDRDSSWRIENKWQYFNLSPYYESFILDVDMLFLSDVSHWWVECWGPDMVPTLDVLTYRGETVSSTYYRKVFELNNLQNIYTGVYYFKKSDLCQVFFDTTKLIFQNWEEWYQRLLPKATPTHVSADVVYALAWDVMGLTASSKGLTFTHMKSKVQNWGRPQPDDWTKAIPWYYGTDSDLFIGNYHQMGVLHYVQKDFIYQNDLLTRMKREYGLRILQR